MNVQGIISAHVYIQQLDYTCGPASILNILHLKGDFSKSEEGLTKLCEARPGIGTSNEGILKACKSLGLEIQENKQDALIEDIERNLENNAFVIVNYFDAFTGEGHYSVITDYDDLAFYFVDSSFGLLRFEKKDFMKNWHNSKNTIRRWYAAVK